MVLSIVYCLGGGRSKCKLDCMKGMGFKSPEKSL